MWLYCYSYWNVTPIIIDIDSPQYKVLKCRFKERKHSFKMSTIAGYIVFGSFRTMRNCDNTVPNCMCVSGFKYCFSDGVMSVQLCSSEKHRLVRRFDVWWRFSLYVALRLRTHPSVLNGCSTIHKHIAFLMYCMSLMCDNSVCSWRLRSSPSAKAQEIPATLTIMRKNPCVSPPQKNVPRNSQTFKLPLPIAHHHHYHHHYQHQCRYTTTAAATKA